MTSSRRPRSSEAGRPEAEAGGIAEAPGGRRLDLGMEPGPSEGLAEAALTEGDLPGPTTSAEIRKALGPTIW